MRVSGNNFRLVPGVREFSFDFGPVSLYPHTGIAQIGFSGSGRQMQFSFQNGKVYDFNNRYVFDLGSGESINISGDITTGRYKTYINGILNGQSAKPDLGLQKFFVNTTGCQLLAFPKLRASINLSAYDLRIQPSFFAGGLVTGRFNNNSDIDFHVYSSRITYDSADNAAFSGSISGNVPAMDGLDFTLKDINSSRATDAFSFRLIADTSLGTVEKSFSLTRSGNLTGDLHLINESNFKGGTIDIPLTGSGMANSFLYQRPNSGTNIISLKYDRYSNSGEAKDKTLYWQVKPVYPTGDSTQTGSFVTGFAISNSGFYSERPYATFLEYSKVAGLDFNPNNLFSFGCGTILPVVFNAVSGLGLGGTGTAHLKLVNIPVYGGTKFYSITGIDLVGGGTGYNYIPGLRVVTGGSCYDVPRVSGNSYIYTPFTGSGILEKQAGYLYGELLTGQRVMNISGVSRTGYAVTGQRISNVGSGYQVSSGFVPAMTVRRTSTDLFSSIAASSGLNASGSYAMNTSGDSYSFTGNWIFKSGLLFNGISPLSPASYYGGSTGYSGSISLKKNESNIYLYSYYKQATFDSPITVQWSFSTDQPTGKSVILSGRRFTTPFSGMYKTPNTSFDTGIYIEF